MRINIDRDGILGAGCTVPFVFRIAFHLIYPVSSVTSIIVTGASSETAAGFGMSRNRRTGSVMTSYSRRNENSRELYHRHGVASGT